MGSHNIRLLLWVWKDRLGPLAHCLLLHNAKALQVNLRNLFHIILFLQLWEPIPNEEALTFPILPETCSLEENVGDEDIVTQKLTKKNRIQIPKMRALNLTNYWTRTLMICFVMLICFKCNLRVPDFKIRKL